MSKIAIIGFGTAGYNAVKAIRSCSSEIDIDVFSDTNAPPYNPMLTTYYAAGRIDFDALFPYGSMEDLRRELKFNLIGEAVERIDAKNKIVYSKSVERKYDKILLATGARAFAPSIEGLSAEDRFLMRTVDDAVRLKERLAQGDVHSAIVVGASMVGVKIVELLNDAGTKTALTDLADHIFPLAAFADVAEEIERRVERKGVSLYFGSTISRVRSGENGKIAILTNGKEIPFDIVILCIGTRANSQLLENQATIGRGVVVDCRMRTSVEGVYAAGDCCEGRNLAHDRTQIIGLWANANHQGHTAGLNMAGRDVVFDGNIPHNITHFMDIEFIGYGDNTAQGDTLEYGNINEGLYIRLVFKDKRIAGANILDDFSISGIIKNYVLRLIADPKAEIPAFQKGMLMKSGLPDRFLRQMEEKLHG